MNGPNMYSRDWLIELLGDHTPTEEAVDASRRRLQAEYAATQGRSMLVARWAAALAVAIAAVAAFVLSPFGTPPADSTLTEIARVARTIDATELPEGTYVYFETRLVVHGLQTEIINGAEMDASLLVDETRRAWWQGSNVLEESTVVSVRLLTPASADVYDATGGDAGFRVGETVTTTLTGVASEVDAVDWSTDPDELRGQITEALADAAPTKPAEALTLDLVAQILNPRRYPSPGLRAAALDVLARLDLDVQELDGVVEVTATYETELAPAAESLVFDREGNLVGLRLVYLEPVPALGLTPNIPISEIAYSVPLIAEEPGVVPPS